jgi:mRNA-degrading endonuclease toxin of MazEF toxin-antitoxin module
VSFSPGEIYFVEQNGSRRPAIVVSREQLNRGNTIVVVYITSQRFDERKDLPNCVPFYTGDFGLTKNSIAQAEQRPWFR